jgi:flavin reductase (DIM6/NTAB) family NADH-FMN oxidoreductase RutF
MAAPPVGFDAAYFRTALGHFATGVTVVTTENAQGEPVGLTVSSFNSVSLDPPLVLWSLSAASTSLEAFQQCERYVVHVLAADQLQLAERFARGSTPDRYAGVRVRRAPGGTLMLDESCAAWFECDNRSRYPEGDHVIMVGHVRHCGHSGALPLVFHAGGFDLTPSPNSEKSSA